MTPRSDAAAVDGSQSETGSPDDAGSGDVAALPEDGALADAATADGANTDASIAAPIVAPNERWTWVSIDGMRCGNGQPTGVAVNLTNRSRRVMVIVQGGGACWDVATCFVLRSAANLESGYGAAQFESERVNLESAALLDRRAANNAFADASYVFVPYCTGDMHSGTRVMRYEALGMTRDVHHVGARNMDALMPRLQATFASADKLWLYGISAGGYGVIFNWLRFSQAFRSARVDALSDCGVPVTPPDGRYATWVRTWGSQLPPGCADCDRNLTSVLLAQLAAHRTSRFGQLAFTDDQVLRTFYGLGPADFAPLVRTLHTRLSTEPNARTFVVTSDAHVMAGAINTTRTADGTVLGPWLQQWATDSPMWASHAPY
ncbi:MAG: pectin acetylesterase-family hydrolase [Deltaproteobacteria bacterium]|nr:pectin acetylesterase-family hydrolase [Deltaproteobacteria bacterium]